MSIKSEHNQSIANQTDIPPNQRPKVLYWGMQGAFSQAVLAALLAARWPICGLLLPARAKPLPVVPRRLSPPDPDPLHSDLDLPLLTPYIEPTILHLAWSHTIPVWEVGRLATPEIAALVAELKPNIACVACFPRRIPAHLLDILPLGFLNVHPSLLPAYRGPAPLFWMLRDGVTQMGVTIHFMDATLDTGDITRQAAITLPDGLSGPEADRLLGQLGGQLLVETLQALATGEPERRPQPEDGSYPGLPSAADFRLETTWTARRAFNFMRGAQEWGMPYPVAIGDVELHLATALAFDPQGILDAPFIRTGQTVTIQFNPGTLTAQLWV